jgi:hypothetical protein
MISNEIEEAVKNHKLHVDKQIKTEIDKGIANGSIAETDFRENESGEKMFTLFDQEDCEIVYNYTLSKVYSYGGNVNE